MTSSLGLIISGCKLLAFWFSGIRLILSGMLAKTQVLFYRKDISKRQGCNCILITELWCITCLNKEAIMGGF